MHIIILAISILGTLGILSAVILFLTERKFHVDEDPRLEEIESLLPGANCGGCGQSGCHDFASACLSAGSLENLRCPSAGHDTMNRISLILGINTSATVPVVASIICNGNCTGRVVKSYYDGPSSCNIQNSVYAGAYGCVFGCLGGGDCVEKCRFDAIVFDEKSMLPVINEGKCVGCGACVKECPRHIIALVEKRGNKCGRIYVACSNRNKGAIAVKECKSACIGCGKCKRECPFEAIDIINNLAYINADKCGLCGKCVSVCPTNAILSVNVNHSKKEEVSHVENL